MGPSDSRNIVAGAVMPRFTTASAIRSSSARSSLANSSASDFIENAWESSSRTLSHFPAIAGLEEEVITVWKGSRNLLPSGIIWRGWGGVNELWRVVRDLRERRDAASSEFCVLSCELQTDGTGENSVKRATVRISENSEPRTQNSQPRAPSRSSRESRATHVSIPARCCRHGPSDPAGAPRNASLGPDAR